MSGSSGTDGASTDGASTDGASTDGASTDGAAFVELLGRARVGDSAARQELFAYLGDNDRFFRVLYAMVRRLFPKTHQARGYVEAQDLVQSAISTGMSHIDQFRGGSEAEFYGWFRSILRSKLNRVARRLKSMPDDLTLTAMQRPSEQPLSRLIAEEIREVLSRAITELTPDHRLVIELRLRGASSSEISDILRIKPATVRKRESRAIDKLRQLVE